MLRSIPKNGATVTRPFSMPELPDWLGPPFDIEVKQIGKRYIMNPWVSVQIIAKETTPLGELFYQCCLRALFDSMWPDEVIVIDNGCSKEVVTMVNEFKSLFSVKSVPVHITTLPDNATYSELRNTALQATNPKANIFHWVDTDEVYFPEQLNALKMDLTKTRDFKQAYTYFYHFCFSPKQIQFKATKDNIFRYTPDLRWEKGVHEHVAGLVGTEQIQTNITYLHLGYLRPQWQTCLKWLHYDMIEHGNVDRYKDERFEDESTGAIYTKPYFRDWRTPDTVLQDRVAECDKNPEWDPNEVPEAARPIFDRSDDWADFLLETEDHEFWDWWVEERTVRGSWAATLDAVVERMEACGWSYDGKPQHQGSI